MFYLTSSFYYNLSLRVFDYSEAVFTPSKEKLFQLENGFYLLFYHRQKVST
jgi:hypothetical protein